MTVSFAQSFGPTTGSVAQNKSAQAHQFVGECRQLRIEDAIEAGNEAMQACNDKAQRTDPNFTERASAAILAHLRIVGQCSGEVLTDVARAHGAVPHDDRAFGAVFKALSRRGLIRTVGYCERTKGHGTAGGRVWGISR